jgi:hypothetical protein
VILDQLIRGELSPSAASLVADPNERTVLMFDYPIAAMPALGVFAADLSGSVRRRDKPRLNLDEPVLQHLLPKRPQEGMAN